MDTMTEDSRLERPRIEAVVKTEDNFKYCTRKPVTYRLKTPV
jgi:hypothetical protein